MFVPFNTKDNIEFFVTFIRVFVFNCNFVIFGTILDKPIQLILLLFVFYVPFINYFTFFDNIHYAYWYLFINAYYVAPIEIHNNIILIIMDNIIISVKNINNG